MAAQDTQKILRTENLNVHFPVSRGLLRRTSTWVRAVNDVSLTVDKGQTLAIVGESGSGKTTLGHAIARLLKPTSGRVFFENNDITATAGLDLREVRRGIQVVFQNPNGSLNPRMRIGDLLGEPLAVRGFSKTDCNARVQELLDAVGLSRTYASRYPHEFSGGQKQRIAIGRALAIWPRLIVFDEPVSALDVSVQAQILQLLGEIRKNNELTSIFITHDLSVVRVSADHVIVMYLGKIMESGRVLDILRNPRHPYTLALVSAVPSMEPAQRQSSNRIVLNGEIPNPAHPPTGCPFRTRCWKAQDICASQSPVLVKDKIGHEVACHFPNQAA